MYYLILNSKKIKFKFICKDLIDKKILYSIKEKIDVVIHLASITNAEQSFKFKKKIYKNNYGIFKNVVYFCIKKVKLILFQAQAYMEYKKVLLMKIAKY